LRRNERVEIGEEACVGEFFESQTWDSRTSNSRFAGCETT
jgi:hypothetical protein